MDSLQVAEALKHYGFQEVETKTHAVGYTHPALLGQRVYVKVARSKRSEKATAVAKQPLVLHPMVARRPGFDTTRVARLGPNHAYKNANMSTFPHKPGESACGIAVDVPDMDALLELLAALGVQMVPVSGVVVAPETLRFGAQTVVPSDRPAVAPVAARSLEPRPVARKAAESSRTFHARQDIDLGEHCCQGTGRLKAGPFELDALTIAQEGARRLRFAPLGNRPVAPRLALVGITPGGQIERFADALATMSVEEAASHAAFYGAQTEIKQLLRAHGFAESLEISLESDLNDNPDILTTSVVKCCLMVDDGYRFAAPDIAASPAANLCATERLVGELCAYPTLRWVVVFGRPAWEAMHELEIEGKSVLGLLRDHGLTVIQFPHFAQNFQQRALFACSSEQEAELLRDKPDYAKYADAASRMRSILLRELKEHRKEAV
ncbi:MAG: hypothetical protein EPN68_01095 [Rhodanobacter sp.]|nr:MAG: hypothetical protein EPN68_01095 [Rhodanobacter sp.]